MPVVRVTSYQLCGSKAPGVKIKAVWSLELEMANSLPRAELCSIRLLQLLPLSSHLLTMIVLLEPLTTKVLWSINLSKRAVITALVQAKFALVSV